MKKIIIVIVAWTLILSIFFPIVIPSTQGDLLTKFSDDTTEKQVIFPSMGGTNSSVSIELPKAAYVTNAHFNITGQHGSSGDMPKNVVIDVGDDDDIDWKFNGTGYGSLGKQNVFSDDNPELFLEFDGPGFNDSNSIYLPKKANVTKATAEVVGGAGKTTIIWEDDFSTHKGWTGYSGAAQWQRAPAKKSTYDPGRDHSRSADNYILGNNIGGNYNNDIASKTWITSPYIDLRGYSNVYFSYYRILSVESRTYDRVEVQVNDGTTWRYLWTNPTGIDAVETRWTFIEENVSNYADGNRWFRIRFGLGPTDYAINYGGWNIDDVTLSVGSPRNLKTIPIWEDDFSTDKNWTGYNGSAKWERGPAKKGSSKDPSKDNTPTSDNYLIGNVIGGYYNNDIKSTDWLTTPIINCSNYRNVHLEYYYQIDIDARYFDHAYVEATDGNRWNYIWANSKTNPMYQSSWKKQSFYLPYGDFYENFQVRFGLGPTDKADRYCGWSVDDTAIIGTPMGTFDSFVDIGNDGSQEWNFTGEFNDVENILNLSTVLNSYLSSAPVAFIDAWGNEIVEIPINISANSSGILQLRNVDIEYNYTPTVNINPHSGDLTNELNQLLPHKGTGNMTIPIKIFCGNGGIINISDLFIEYYIPPITNEDITLLNGHGPEGKICYAGYQTYNIRANMSSRLGYDYVSNVTLILAPGSYDITLSWNKSTDNFIELSDPYDFITLVPNSCISITDYISRWSLVFAIDVHWSYPDELLTTCILNSSSGSFYIENDFDEIYRIENDLEFSGYIQAVASTQGPLLPGSWVKGAEKIRWSGLTVVYENTTNIYPPNGAFNVTVTNDTNFSWVNTSSSGSPFNLETCVDTITDFSDIHHIDITEIPGTGQDISNITFEIKVDATPPLPPLNVLCHSDGPGEGSAEFDNDGIVYVTWSGGPWQDAESGKYADAMAYNDPSPTSHSVSGDSVLGEEGLATVYVRSIDNVGNWGTSGFASIFIDLTPLVYSNSFPEPFVWQTSKRVEVGVTITDTGSSGVCGSEIQYRYTSDGVLDDEVWFNYPITSSGEIINASTIINFGSDGTKLAQWRAKDMANIESTQSTPYITSPKYSLKIDSTPPTIEFAYPHFWQKSNEVEMKVYINDTGGSGLDILNVEYALSSDNGITFTPWQKATVNTHEGDQNKTELTLTEVFVEGIENRIKLHARDLAGNEVVTEPIEIQVDTTPPTYYDIVPSQNHWQRHNTIKVGITFRDNLSSLEPTSLEYRVIRNTYNHEPIGNWESTDEYMFDYEGELTTRLDLTFEDGEDNAIKWRIRDIAGNILETEPFQIKIDTVPLTFGPNIPDPETWQRSQYVNCRILIQDIGGSGVDANSIQYRISTTGKSGYGEWLEIKNLENEEKINASVTVEFPEGVSNYIQWRARDVAGNKYKESPIYQIKVDSEPVTFSEPIPNPIRVLTSNTHLIGITITDKRSGVDSTKIFYSFSYDNKKSWSAWEPFDALDAASFKSNQVSGQVSGMTVLPASRSTFIKWLAYD
ncbi:hypothetical protein, partial [[Eubacterium] cellulosolvens]